MMTAAVVIAGLLPIMWSGGTGSEVMRRIATPMLGGMITALVLSMFVVPVVCAAVRGLPMRASGARGRRDANDSDGTPQRGRPGSVEDEQRLS